MSILFQNGFAIGTTSGGGGGPQTGHPLLTINIAESNSTGLFFMGVPYYQYSGPNTCPGYAQGWNGVTIVTNSGAQFWEYISLSYLQFATPQSNLTVHGEDQILETLYSHGLSTIGDAILGTSSSPTLVDNYNGTNSNSTQSVVDNVVSSPGEFIIISSGVETKDGAPVSSIVSIDGGGLTWAKRSAYLDSTSNTRQKAECWYAFNTNVSVINTNITITYDNQFDDQSAIVSTWSGVNTSQPFTSSPVATSNMTSA